MWRYQMFSIAVSLRSLHIYLFLSSHVPKTTRICGHHPVAAPNSPLPAALQDRGAATLTPWRPALPSTTLVKVGMWKRKFCLWRIPKIGWGCCLRFLGQSLDVGGEKRASQLVTRRDAACELLRSLCCNGLTFTAPCHGKKQMRQQIEQFGSVSAIKQKSWMYLIRAIPFLLLPSLARKDHGQAELDEILKLQEN